MPDTATPTLIDDPSSAASFSDEELAEVFEPNDSENTFVVVAHATLFTKYE